MAVEDGYASSLIRFLQDKLFNILTMITVILTSNVTIFDIDILCKSNCIINFYI